MFIYTVSDVMGVFFLGIGVLIGVVYMIGWAWEKACDGVRSLLDSNAER